MMLVKIHSAYRQAVAICDSNLIGRKIEEGVKQLDLTVDFFKGEEKTEQEAKEIIWDYRNEDATFFIVGKESVDLCKGIGLISGEGVVKIGGVPVALVLM